MAEIYIPDEGKKKKEEKLSELGISNDSKDDTNIRKQNGGTNREDAINI